MKKQTIREMKSYLEVLSTLEEELDNYIRMREKWIKDEKENYEEQNTERNIPIEETYIGERIRNYQDEISAMQEVKKDLFKLI